MEAEKKWKTKSKRKIWNQPQRDKSLIAVRATIPYTYASRSTYTYIISMFVNILKESEIEMEKAQQRTPISPENQLNHMYFSPSKIKWCWSYYLLCWTKHTKELETGNKWGRRAAKLSVWIRNGFCTKLGQVRIKVKLWSVFCFCFNQTPARKVGTCMGLFVCVLFCCCCCCLNIVVQRAHTKHTKDNNAHISHIFPLKLSHHLLTIEHTDLLCKRF